MFSTQDLHLPLLFFTKPSFQAGQIQNNFSDSPELMDLGYDMNIIFSYLPNGFPPLFCKVHCRQKLFTW